jgi:hypothetical protein
MQLSTLTLNIVGGERAAADHAGDDLAIYGRIARSTLGAGGRASGESAMACDPTIASHRKVAKQINCYGSVVIMCCSESTALGFRALKSDLYVMRIICFNWVMY